MFYCFGNRMCKGMTNEIPLLSRIPGAQYGPIRKRWGPSVFKSFKGHKGFWNDPRRVFQGALIGGLLIDWFESWMSGCG